MRCTGRESVAVGVHPGDHIGDQVGAMLERIPVTLGTPRVTWGTGQYGGGAGIPDLWARTHMRATAPPTRPRRGRTVRRAPASCASAMQAVREGDITRDASPLRPLRQQSKPVLNSGNSVTVDLRRDHQRCSGHSSTGARRSRDHGVLRRDRVQRDLTHGQDPSVSPPSARPQVWCWSITPSPTASCHLRPDHVPPRLVAQAASGAALRPPARVGAVEHTSAPRCPRALSRPASSQV